MVSALAALGIAGFASPAAAGPERAVEALFVCDANFFEVWERERAAFHSQEVMTVLREHQRIEIVKFDPPVEVLGLRLTSYRQQTTLDHGGFQPSSFSWGFQVDETPSQAVLALRKYFPDGFEGTDAMLYSTKGYPGQPGKLFAISKPRLAGETGANLECLSPREYLGNIWSLPDVVDLFSETWNSKRRWLAWTLGWLH
ncbi:MAG: hypothetical protein ACREEJ_23890 [Ensifer adhaerens]